MRRRPRLADILALTVLVGVPLLACLAGARGPVAATLKLGPNAGAYLTGFAPKYEIEGSQATWWTSYHAAVELPLAVSGPVQASYRFARVLPETAQVDVRFAGGLADHFACRGGIYETRRAEVVAAPGTPLKLAFDVDSHDRRNLGLRMDWVRFTVGPGGRLTPRAPVVWLGLGLVAAVFACLRWSGHGPFAAMLLLAPLSLGATAWVRSDPFAFAHVALRLALPAAFLAAALALLVRRVPGGRWVMAILVAGYLIKGVGLFHPTSFYPDFGNARRYVEALRETTGPIAERTLTAQVRTNVGYPRFVAGKAYAFPYAPLFFLPFGWIGRADLIEDAFRHAGLLAASLEALLVFFLARLLESARADSGRGSGLPPGVAAAVVSAVIPPLFSRMLLAMTVTLVGHLLDLALIAATLGFLLRPDSRPFRYGLSLAALLSLLSYVSSLFTVSAFLAMIALLERKHAVRFLATLGVSLAIVVGWLYAPFAWAFATEILPAAARGARVAAAGASLTPAGPVHAVSRIFLFYGLAYPALAAGGLALLRRRLDPRAFHVLAAHALAFGLLLSLRGFGGGLFRDLKEITFVAPLVAVLSGAVIEELARRGRAGRVAALLVLAGLAAYGLGRYHGYLAEYASPFLIVTN